MSSPATWSGAAVHRGTWTLASHDSQFVLTSQDVSTSFAGQDAGRIQVRRRWWFRMTLVVDGERIGTMRRSVGKSLAAAIAAHLLVSEFRDTLDDLARWASWVVSVFDYHEQQGRWIPEQQLEEFEQERPRVATLALEKLRLNIGVRSALTPEERAVVDWYDRNLRSEVMARNEGIVRQELVDRSDFLRSIEASPLTEEQARAVLTFDNHVSLVAAAGSGKTSVMVARAAYAIERDFVAPERILLLAFNKAAATELQERVDSRLAAAGLPSDGVRASTFHAFGLTVIGQATGRKPRLASWLDSGQDVKMVMRIVDELRDSSPDFRFKWDVYRLLYARVDEDPAHEVIPDAWDKVERRNGLGTFSGAVVKSQGERMIADWLFLNGVEFEYEKPYPVDVADSTHSQYRPDFFYPDVGAWHEHWALDYDGRPPEEFVGYADSMRWKKALHRQHGTTLVETTWARMLDTSGFNQLADDLTALGLHLDWNPDRTIPGVRPVKHEDLARLIRTFMAHVKSNSLDRRAIEHRLARSTHAKSHRTALFLEIYWEIHDQWEARLAADDSIDFEDMLVKAAQLIESGKSHPAYDLVLVDEFQDASHARARLVAALTRPRDTYLLAVGDDWQAINRFAGADISVMTGFEQWFGRGPTLRLGTTFRCTQEICDVFSTFVSKNPSQIAKTVTSVHGSGGAPVLLTYAASSDGISGAVRRWLDDLAEQVEAGEVVADRDDTVTVYVLGRYRFDRDNLPTWSHPDITVTFSTVHGSKGLEADFVIIPNTGRGTYGFPSQIADDPVLELAMSRAEDFEHSEERRLFYVALTRARRQAVLVAVAGSESAFITELREEGHVWVDPGGYQPPVVCPTCKEGVLVKRSGPYGDFLGCSTFPRCRHTARV